MCKSNIFIGSNTTQMYNWVRLGSKLKFTSHAGVSQENNNGQMLFVGLVSKTKNKDMMFRFLILFCYY